MSPEYFAGMGDLSVFRSMLEICSIARAWGRIVIKDVHRQEGAAIGDHI
jgi:hypothetical protein